MMKGKTFAEKVEKAIFLEDDDVLWKSEIEGNKLLSYILVLFAFLLILTFLAAKFDLFQVMSYIMPVTVIGLIELIISLFISYHFRWERKWIKVMLLFCAMLICAEVDVLLTCDVVIIMAIPTVLSIRYFNKRLTVFIAVISVFVFALSCWLGCLYGQLNVRNVLVPTGDVIEVVEDSLRVSVALHGFDMRAYVLRTLRFSYLSKLMGFSVIAVVSTIIAGVGRELVFEKEYESRKNERIASELSLASRIQLGELPRTFPAFPTHAGIDLYATMHPAKEVGGDFYDFFEIDADHVALVMADVSGKGIPAALFMMRGKALIRNYIKSEVSPAAAMNAVNVQLCENNEEDLFITAWVGVLEVSTSRLTFVNAGHCHPLLCRRKTAQFREMEDVNGLPLACFDDTTYEQSEIQLCAGDEIFLYTDGVTEATDSSGEMYGPLRLAAYLSAHSTAPLQELLPTLRDNIDSFVGGAPQFDDIAMQMLRLNSAE